MFKAVFSKIGYYLGLIDDVLVDFLGDIKSFRVQLVYMGYLFNAVALWAVIYKGLDWKILTVTFGTQTIIYGFYFSSHRHQAELAANAAPEEAEGDPDAGEKDPDKI